MVLQVFSYAFDEILPPQPLTSLIGLNDEEKQMLANLGYRAKTFAPFLGKTLAFRIQEYARLNTSYLSSSADMQLYLQDWFLQLFQCREEKIRALSIARGRWRKESGVRSGTGIPGETFRIQRRHLGRR